MNTPTELKYSKSHEWVQELENGKVRIGLTDYAQQELGDIVFVNLPGVGDELTVGEACADVESVKAVSDIYSPVSAVVSAVNEALLDAPELINADCYDAWLLEADEVTQREELLGAEDYEAFVAEGA
ncbi:MAG: glycine cleavage system protein GcvH [Oscillospiraceae bacterium]|jgi:glycine cleavage system H protein